MLTAWLASEGSRFACKCYCKLSPTNTNRIDSVDRYIPVYIRTTHYQLPQVFLVVEPKFEWDADAVKRREKAVKRAKLAAADLFRTSPLDDAPTASEPGKLFLVLLGIKFLFQGGGMEQGFVGHHVFPQRAVDFPSISSRFIR